MNRREFLPLLGAAMVAPALPAVPAQALPAPVAFIGDWMRHPNCRCTLTLPCILEQDEVFLPRSGFLAARGD